MSQPTEQVVSDEAIDPHLAAMSAAYGLMIAAKREPGTWKCRAFPADQARLIVERAIHEDFQVKDHPHNTDQSKRAISVMWGLPRKASV